MFCSFREYIFKASTDLGPVSDHVLINRESKERALHQVIKYSASAIC